jgi:aryl-alcohol dehydrogenase-like predicted oxidoreductase
MENITYKEKLMNYVKLGNTGIDVSVISLGCWPFAGDNFWGPQKDEDSIETVSAALDNGINFMDTAESYGKGRSEEVLGKALKGRRDKAVIATKINSDWTNDSHMSREGVFFAAEQSLKRLQSDYIDLYYIHWPHDDRPLEETLDAMFELKKQGKIRAVGICNFGLQNLKRLASYKEKGFAVVHQLPYSLLWRAIEDNIKEETLKLGMGLICYSPLSQGLLTGLYNNLDTTPDYIKGTRFFHHSRSPSSGHGEDGCEEELYAVIKELKTVSQDIGISMPEMALGWLLQQKGIISILAGSRKPSEIVQNAAAAEVNLSNETVNKLSSITQKVRNKLGSNPDMWVGQKNTRFH